MNIQIIETGDYGVNCSIVSDSAGNAFVADPGSDADAITQALYHTGLVLRGYLVTHGHLDHISALPDLVAAMPAPVYMHQADAAWAFTPINAIPGYRQVLTPPATIVSGLADGQVIEFGGLCARVICTPGHTPGGVCYYFEGGKALIAGDTLFRGSVGRTDLPGGNWDTLAASLGKLMELDDDVAVVTGHGECTTIGAERRDNPFIAQIR